ncbi:MAG: polyprenyl synthetase family protein [Myxococcota bacterium]|nr:polyprenyl synthetase family protein [Myxococcota bacterium]
MDLPGYLAERVPLVDAALESLLPPVDRPPRALHAAMRHLIFPGGKRLRPALCFATAEALGRRPEVALPAAAAVELIHSYSLIHDDLPCMDDDALRRGRPSVHVAFGESTAVLAGDALQALAFEALGDRAADAASAVGCLRELAGAAGASGLVGGQVDDLAVERGDGEPATQLAGRIESVHQRKSARLIAAAMACSARLAGADEPAIDRLRAAGGELGVAFQIADDWLDRERDETCSLVRAVGADGSRERAEGLLASALGRLEALGDAAEPLRELMRFAVRRSS